MSAYSNKSSTAFQAAFKKKPINVKYQSDDDPMKQALGAFSKKPKTPWIKTAVASTVPPPTTGIKGPTGEMPGTPPAATKSQQQLDFDAYVKSYQAKTGNAVAPAWETETDWSQKLKDEFGAPSRPVDVNAQSQELATLANQMAKARTSGDMGTLNTLTAQYSKLVQSMQTQVAAAPAGTGVTGQAATPAEQQQLQTLLAAKKTAESTGGALPADQAALLAQLQAKMAAAPAGTGVTGQAATPAEQQQLQTLLAAKKTAESTGSALPPDQAKLLADLQAKMGAGVATEVAPTGTGAAAAAKGGTTQTAQSATTGGPGGESAIPEPPGGTTTPPAPTAGPGSEQWQTDIAASTKNFKEQLQKRKPGDGGYVEISDWIAQQYQSTGKMVSLEDVNAWWTTKDLANLTPEQQTGLASLDTQIAGSSGMQRIQLENKKKAMEKAWGINGSIMGDTNIRDVLTDWTKELTAKNTAWQQTGQYENQLQTMMNTPPPGSTVKIADLPETLKNEFYREAMDALKNGKDPKDLIGDYLSYFDQNVDFNLKPAGYEEKTKDIHDYTSTTAVPGVTELGAANTSGITGALGKQTQSEVGKAATGAVLDALMKRLQSGGIDTQQLGAQYDVIKAEVNANVSAMAHDLANAGQSMSGTTPAALAAVRQQGIDKMTVALQTMQQKGMELNQQDFQNTIQQLTALADQESQRLVAERGQDITGQTSATELQTRREEVSKTLFQEGQLTIYSEQVEENLKEYGMSLEKYQTDKGFDEAGLDRDLKARLAQSDLDVEEQKLKYQQVKDSIDFAMQEKTGDDKRNAQIAELEQKGAQGDQDANFKVQSLRVEQDLRDRGMTNEQARFNGNLMFYLLNNREERSQELLMFYEGLKAQKAMQGSPWLDFLGQFIGVAATVAGTVIAGPAGGAVAATTTKTFA